jgi:hypothetical protein
LLLSSEEIKMRRLLFRATAAALLVSSIALGALSAPPPVPKPGPVNKPLPPTTAKAYLQSWVDWCKQSKPGWSPNRVHLVMVSNCPDKQQDAGYTETDQNDLSLVGKTQLQTTGDTHYYNNKRWGPGFSTYPFDPKVADHPKLTLDAATGQATVPSGVFPGALVTIDLQYAHGVLYGQASRTDEMFVITLTQQPGRPPPP